MFTWSRCLREAIWSSWGSTAPFCWIFQLSDDDMT